MKKTFSHLLTARSKKQEAEHGFTIIETLIALTIFSIAVAGIITVTVQGGVSTGIARDQVVASYLAEEGIELLRGRRDTTVIATSGDPTVGWGDFVNTMTAGAAPCTPASPCDTDAVDPLTIVSCTGSCPPLNYRSDAGFYNHLPLSSNNAPSIFTRTLSVSKTSDDEVEITSTVSWHEGASTSSVTQKERLFNWYTAP